ncbi:serine/arginine repetitive matrix protein 2 [Nocardioides sp.]|uniref:Serine/arginine repetitive matrix protein 2 n=1 Tax=metagenome TaxID=256318 RepID=A0A2P2BX70_9ZZZZ
MTTQPTFVESEGLRNLLTHLHSSGPEAWSRAPEATDLVTYAMDKYGALARKHGQEPADAAVAAFEVMLTRAARDALDPWAVITRAVQLTLTYDARANGLLCSTGRARRAESAGFHDAERFSERETPVYEYHPAFTVPAESESYDGDPLPESDAPTNALVALDRAVSVFMRQGWPEETARSGVEYICSRLMRTGSRLAAFEYLRRDRHARALFDLDQRCWLAMLRAVLGNQHPDRAHTSAGRGLLLLLVIGYDVEDVLEIASITRPITRGVRALEDGHTHG